MKKERNIILLIALATILIMLIGVICISISKNKKEAEVIIDNNVVTTITLDINPSIKIELNKDNQIVNIIALNADAKKVIPENYKGKTLEDTVKEIATNVVEKGYAKEKVVILLNVDGQINEELLTNTINNSFIEKQVESEVIIPVITESAKEDAKKYNITEAKAAYIEKVIVDYPELTIESLKDENVTTLKTKEIEKEIPEPIETPKEEVQTQTNTNTNTNTNQNTNSNSNSYSSCTPPSDLKSSEWCRFNVSRPQSCEYNYPQKINNTSELMNNTLTRLGINPTEALNRYTTETKYEGSSYCLAIKMNVSDKNYNYTLLFDSVTGELLNESKEAVPSFIDEATIKQKALEHFGLNEADVVMMWVSTGIEGSGGPNEYYRHQVNIEMPERKMYTADYNAVTGVLVTERIWQNQ